MPLIHTKVDWLHGGIPCPPFSRASNKPQGLHDPRQLFHAAHLIAQRFGCAYSFECTPFHRKAAVQQDLHTINSWLGAPTTVTVKDGQERTRLLWSNMQLPDQLHSIEGRTWAQALTDAGTPAKDINMNGAPLPPFCPALLCNLSCWNSARSMIGSPTRPLTPEERCAIVGMQAQDCGQDVRQAYRMTGNAIPVALHAALISAFLEPHTICAAALGGASPPRPNDGVEDDLLPSAAQPSDKISYGEGRPAFEQLFKRFEKLFEPPRGVPPDRGRWNFLLNVKEGAVLPKAKPYPLAPLEKLAQREHISKELESGRAKRGTSDCTSSMFFAKNSPTKSGPRAVVNYGPLNKISAFQSWPLPLASELFTDLGVSGSTFFTVVDIKAAFHRVRNADARTCQLQAYICAEGTFLPSVMQMGLESASNHFQFLITSMLRGADPTGKTDELVDTDLTGFALAFVDDIIIFSKSFEDHLKHVEAVLERMAKWGFNVSKVDCAKREIKFLGHMVGQRGTRPCPDKVQALQDMHIKDGKRLHTFLGAVSFFRNFLPKLSVVAAPAMDYLNANKTPRLKRMPLPAEIHLVIDKVKDMLSTAILNAQPQPFAPYSLYTDASNAGWGGVLMQHHQPIAVASGKWTGPQSRWSTFEQELGAIVCCTKKWRRYLLNGCKHRFYSDHQPLQFELTRVQEYSSKVLRWLDWLSSFSYEVKYLPGLENFLADLLSRPEVLADPDRAKEASTQQTKQQDTPSAVDATTASASASMTARASRRAIACVLAVQDLQQDANDVMPAILDVYDKALHMILDHLTDSHAGPQRQQAYQKEYADLQPLQETHERADQGVHVFLHGGRVLIPTSIARKVVEFLHQGHHRGIGATVQHVRGMFQCLRLWHHVTEVIKHCNICQISKYPTAKSAHSIIRRDLPATPYSRIGIDLFMPNQSTGMDLLVVQCKLTRHVTLLGLERPAHTAKLIKALRDNVYLQYGVPHVLDSDKDSRVRSEEFSKAHAASGLLTEFTPAGSKTVTAGVERTIRTLREMLLTLHLQGMGLQDALPTAQFIYNTTAGVTGIAPATLLYGYDLGTRTWADPELQAKALPILREYVKDGVQTPPTIHKRSTKMSFKAGDLVLLKNLEVSKRRWGQRPWNGPFRVLQPIAHGNYKIGFKNSGVSIGIWNVACMKRFQGNPTAQFFCWPSHITSSRIKGGELFYNVVWQGFADKQVQRTWERAHELRQDVPSLVEEYELHQQH